MKEFLKSVWERLKKAPMSLSYYDKDSIYNIERYCTKCGKKFIIKEVYPLQKYDFLTGEQYITIEYTCPYLHHTFLATTDRQYISKVF